MTCLHNHDQILELLRKIFLKGFQIYQNYLCALKEVFLLINFQTYYTNSKTNIWDERVCSSETNHSIESRQSSPHCMAERGLSGFNLQANKSRTDLKIWTAPVDPNPCSLVHCTHSIRIRRKQGEGMALGDQRIVTLVQRWHRYYPKFPELYSRHINSLIITALKYLTELVYVINCHFVFNKRILIDFPFFQTFLPFRSIIFYLETLFHFSWSKFFFQTFLPFWSIIFYLETLFYFSWSKFFLSEISWFQEISWKVASLH